MVTGPAGRRPRVVIAAPASGQGKTTVATGLMAALTARGLRVSPHKVGPDYIDPGYHALACGRPGRNLDPFLVGEERIAPLFAHGARDTDIAVVEGVMGLYDGAAGRGDFASTAHVARLLRAPVVLVADARSQGRSIAALVHGFASYDPHVDLAGVVLNRVGTERHEAILREALDPLGIPVLGVLGRHDAIAKPSRHLGLVPVAERRAEAVATVAELGALVRESVDLDAVVRIARAAAPLPAEPWRPGEDAAETGGPAAGRPRIAVAGGAAFTFGYAETPELLRAAGADVCTFDPLRDERLPDGVSGLVIGGGFPEVYAAELSANAALRAAVAALAARGGAIAAECAGLLYLARSLDGAPMCGVLPAEARMTERLTLGYRDAVATADSVLAPAGAARRGHEFHRTAVTPEAGERAAWRWAAPAGAAGKAAATGPGVPAATRLEGFVGGNVHASYLHTHWAGHPDTARRFVTAAGRVA
ncbi:cobyrinate a,c-diamide synthase [Yinghuangia sp. ASG 101]|uniref:cobyrinate a,c-diamide synthase n=1 Tax=Yinghuangia sp. ASG 101 TaxID=2896848 RepID=UPI001E596F96|nr:cobyrinate a,c-diamide synthase [Yinghuangia sp. ASG 101]UGQ10734.1 cobyrinate a,c-diamide synthase [Yinghuangia sp. ASG 101]